MPRTEQELRNAFAAGVYFHSPEKLLTHNAGCLMEGLLELGIPVKANTAKLTSRHVSMPLKGVDLTPMLSEPYAGFAGYIVDISHANAFVPFEGIRDGRLAYLTSSDVSAFCRLPDPHLLLSTHESRFAVKGGARHPLAFGLSKGLAEATKDIPPFAARQHKALRNFRATLSQGVRAMLDLSFVPALSQRLPVDSAVAAPTDYLAALKTAAVCLAYGGEFYSPIMGNPWFAARQPELAKAHAFERFTGPAAILRWDSWRFWETLAAGCLAVHLDFEKYGFLLPEMPVAWEHYVPVDLDDVKGSAEELLDRRSEWDRIAAAGRAWALAHYTPKPTARRVLTAMLAHQGAGR